MHYQVICTRKCLLHDFNNKKKKKKIRLAHTDGQNLLPPNVGLHKETNP